MKRLLLIPLVLFLGCEEKDKDKHGCLDSQACNYDSDATIENNSCIYEYNQCDICPQNNHDFNCLFGDWVASNGIAYYSIDEEKFIFRSAITCSGIIGDLNVVEFTDTCLQTNYSLELVNYLYSFKLLPDNENFILMNLHTDFSENCVLDTLTRMTTDIPCDD